MLASRVLQGAVSPGTATTINLTPPATGWRSFVNVFGSGGAVFYSIEDDAGNWEEGEGTVTAGSPDTLSRTTVLRNSLNTTARINFAGSVRVFNATFAPTATGRAVFFATNAAAARAAIVAGTTLGTSVATTSGSAVAFTGLPAGLNWIDLHLASFSTTGVQVPFARLGTGAGPTYATTGYSADAVSLANAAAVSTASNSTAFTFAGAWTAAIVVSGRLSFRRLGGNVWTLQGALARSDVSGTIFQSGSVTLGAELTAIQLTTADAFDGGTVNATWGF